MKIRKRVFSLLIAFSLVMGMAPVTAFAGGTDTGKSIQLGTGEIAGYSGTNGYDYIYYGEWDYGTGSTPVKWRVLDDQTNMGTEGFFLLSDELLGTGDKGGVKFDADGTSNAWQGSDAQAWCTGFYQGNLTAIEQDYVISTKKNDAEYNGKFGKVENILDNDKIFFLSAEEAESDAYGFSNPDSRKAYYNGLLEHNWWLRSPSINTDNVTGPIWAGLIFYILGEAIHGNVDGPNCARPAFNLATNAILFTSAAVSGKPTGTTGTLSNVNDYTGNEWKLTLLDSSRNFTANVSGQSSASAPAGGSVQITYSGAQTGTDEYVSVLLCDDSDNVLYYGNIAQNSASGTATLNIPTGLATGNYTLKVFSEQCNGDYKTDYASAFQNIALQVTLPQETTPDATFTATSDNGGTLSDVDTSMKYSVDGGDTWNDITGTTMEISGVTAANDVKVYKSGNGTTTSDSEVQTIDVTQAAQPTGIDNVDCTTREQNNGKITGVNSTMEYRLSTDSGWKSVTGEIIDNLGAGTYYVRIKANDTALASQAIELKIEEHICAAGDGWLSNGTDHWKECGCGEIMDKGVHTFVWVTDKDATATEAGMKHEECTVCGYAKAAVEIPATGTPTDPSDEKPEADTPTDTDTPTSGKQTSDTKTPETGDSSNIALWITIMLAAGAALTGTILYSRKKYTR